MHLSKYIKITLSCILLSLFIGCQNKNGQPENDEDDKDYVVIRHLDMHYFNFDLVDNLSLFFDSISNEHEIPIRDIVWEEYAKNAISNGIERLEGYRKGNYKYYPDSLIKECIGTLGFECAFNANHACELDMTYAEWFLMLAAFYSPDISYVVHMQTPDHHAGVFNFGQHYNDNPWWAYIILKREKGFEVQSMGEETKIRSIFQLENDSHRKYYLCSNNLSCHEFLQRLYWVKDDGNIVQVAECTESPIKESSIFDNNTYYFNKNNLMWQYCKINKHTGTLSPIKGTATMTLKLDGKNSCFIITP